MKRSILITLMFFITTFSSSQGKNLSFISREGTWISVDVSPDGKTVAFDLLGHIYLMSSQGGKAKPITQGTSWNMFPRFSPDRMIARGGSGCIDTWVHGCMDASMDVEKV